MKNIILTFMILLVGTLFFFLGTKGNPEIKTSKIIEESEMLYVNFNIPKVVGVKKDIEEKINLKIRSDVDEFRKSVEAFAIPEEGIEIEYSATVDYVYGNIEDNKVSLVLDFTSYTGGAHDNTNRVTYNYDVETGEELKLDMVTEKPFETIKEDIEKKIESEKEKYFEGTEIVIDNSSMFYLRDNKIIIYYNQYDIAPYAAGIIEFEVKE
ncbi:MAG: DUF3298 and DUF4163 domain-containing protein [Clostridia bacterium]|jgi:hypothetical protein|nr:DUF3298 and DUF4163 domain-containing protein [Clostridia bacterium]